MQRYFFPATNRLKTASQFKQVFSNSKKAPTKGCCVFYRANNLNCARLGVIVQKKHIRKSCKRNWFKRQARESFRLAQHSFGGVDIIVLAFKEANTMTSNDVRKNLEKQWQKITCQ